ncbi:hypothetical protein AVEN_17822-1 [Araneus ventricosus]|uniref:Uncharacterized protein n=1 Tax=Araneus ventricosus TaxID=182803 RepID=A0A4Y2MIS4_ARAVE|nr:hypothetical protein AVEN_17822-1 [Araneus ventricosus]
MVQRLLGALFGNSCPQTRKNWFQMLHEHDRPRLWAFFRYSSSSYKRGSNNFQDVVRDQALVLELASIHFKTISAIRGGRPKIHGQLCRSGVLNSRQGSFQPADAEPTCKVSRLL